MNLQPSLNGRLLNLRPLRESDFEALFAVSADPLLWEQHPERFRYQRDVFQRFFTGAMDSRRALIALDAATGEAIGSSRYINLDLARDRVEVGYTFLSRACWGKGYNREMKRLMLAHAFGSVRQVFFYVGESNHRSRTAMGRIGATLVERIERRPAEGAPYASVVFRLTRDEAANGLLRD